MLRHAIAKEIQKIEVITFVLVSYLVYASVLGNFSDNVIMQNEFSLLTFFLFQRCLPFHFIYGCLLLLCIRLSSLNLYLNWQPRVPSFKLVLLLFFSLEEVNLGYIQLMNIMVRASRQGFQELVFISKDFFSNMIGLDQIFRRWLSRSFQLLRKRTKQACSGIYLQRSVCF